MENAAEMSALDIRQPVAGALGHRYRVRLPLVTERNRRAALGTVVGLQSEHVVAAVETRVAAGFFRRGNHICPTGINRLVPVGCINLLQPIAAYLVDCVGTGAHHLCAEAARVRAEVELVLAESQHSVVPVEVLVALLKGAEFGNANLYPFVYVQSGSPVVAFLYIQRETGLQRNGTHGDEVIGARDEGALLRSKDDLRIAGLGNSWRNFINANQFSIYLLAVNSCSGKRIYRSGYTFPTM